jgi:hypothetical protein
MSRNDHTRYAEALWKRPEDLGVELDENWEKHRRPMARHVTAATLAMDGGSAWIGKISKKEVPSGIF